MDFEKTVKERASVRRFQDKAIPRETICKIVELAGRAPSWKNTQVVHYIVVDDKEILKEFTTPDIAGGFDFNVKTLQSAAAIAIQTFEEGISGFNKDGSFSTAKGDRWQMYDAGISAGIFTLAAYAEGVGTVIQGYFDEDAIRKHVDIPKNQQVSALICMGYPEGEIKPTDRKSVEDVVTFVEK